MTLSINLSFLELAVPLQTSDTVITSGPLDAQNNPLSEPLHSAIALKPPNQSNTPQEPDRDTHSPSQSPPGAGLSHRRTEEEATPATTEVAL